MAISFFPAHGRWKAEAFTALRQLIDHIEKDSSFTALIQSSTYSARREARTKAHRSRLAKIAVQGRVEDHETLTPHSIGSLLKSFLPDSTNYVLEAITAAQELHDQLQPSRPGSWLNCGGAGIGWGNGGALGVKMALMDSEKGEQPNMICHIVGDGSFLCGSPASAIWVASKYQIPVLTIVLNNGGWKAPRHSSKLVYPQGMATSASDEEINLSFRPAPNYAALAEAAAGSSLIPADMSGDSTGWMKGTWAYRQGR